jgi:hypothetical protein
MACLDENSDKKDISVEPGLDTPEEIAQFVYIERRDKLDGGITGIRRCTYINQNGTVQTFEFDESLMIQRMRGAQVHTRDLFEFIARSKWVQMLRQHSPSSGLAESDDPTTAAPVNLFCLSIPYTEKVVCKQYPEGLRNADPDQLINKISEKVANTAMADLESGTYIQLREIGFDEYANEISEGQFNINRIYRDRLLRKIVKHPYQLFRLEEEDLMIVRNLFGSDVIGKAEFFLKIGKKPYKTLFFVYQ